MSTASERVEIEVLKGQIQHLRSELQPIEALRSELQAVHDAYPWDHGKRESASSLMTSVVNQVRFQEKEVKLRGEQLEYLREQLVKRDELVQRLRSGPKYEDLRERYRHVLNEARRAGRYLSANGSASHYLFPYLREALEDLDATEEKQKKNTPTD